MADALIVIINVEVAVLLRSCEGWRHYGDSDPDGRARVAGERAILTCRCAFRAWLCACRVLKRDAMGGGLFCSGANAAIF